MKRLVTFLVTLMLACVLALAPASVFANSSHPNDYSFLSFGRNTSCSDNNYAKQTVVKSDKDQSACANQTVAKSDTVRASANQSVAKSDANKNTTCSNQPVAKADIAKNNTCTQQTVAQTKINKNTTYINRDCEDNTCNRGTCEDSTCDGETCEDDTCTDGSCEDDTCTDGSCEDDTCTDSTCENDTCENGTCEDGTCESGNCAEADCPTGNCTNGNNCNAGKCAFGNVCTPSQANLNLANSLQDCLSQRYINVQSSASAPNIGTDKTNSESPAKSSGNAAEFTDEYSQEVIDLVNQERVKAGLKALVADEKLCEATAIRAAEIQTNFSHTRPDGSSCFTALAEVQAKYSGAGENIAIGQNSPAAVVEAWMNSPGHRANILNPNFTRIGVASLANTSGKYGGYAWAQFFAN